MFNSFVIETIICTTRRGSYKLQNTFFKGLRLFELRIDISRLFHSINTDGKKEFLKKICLKCKQGILLDDLEMRELVCRGIKL